MGIEADETIADLEGQQGRALTEKEKAVFLARGDHRFSSPKGAHWDDVRAVIEEHRTEAYRSYARRLPRQRLITGVFTVDWNQPAPDGNGKKLIPNEVVHALVSALQ